MKLKGENQMKIQNTLPTESVEQQTLFRWAAFQTAKYPELDLMFAIPNGGKRHYKTAITLKAEGVKAGIPDIMLPVSRNGYYGLFIELKRIKGGTLTLNQKERIPKIINQGYAVAVCYGFEDAQSTIMNYITGNFKQNKIKGVR